MGDDVRALADGPDWPERLTLRDTKVIADEGQRIYTTATGYGYEKREYVRADVAHLHAQASGTAVDDAMVERAARALIVRKFGPNATMMFDGLPEEATTEQQEKLMARVEEARLDARAALKAALPAPSPTPEDAPRGSDGGSAPRMLERADTLDGKFAITMAWPDGNETVEKVSQNLSDYIEAVLSRPAEQSVAGWRAIDSAPKDGRQFLVWDKTHGVRKALWYERSSSDLGISIFRDDGLNSFKGGIQPTHWQPLPPAPNSGSGDGL